MKKTVIIFGSSIPKPGDKEYEIARLLGKQLGENKISVCSGGYQGIMDAVSKGAVEAGADAVGVTVNIFSAEPSKYLTKNIKCNSLFERIEKLISVGDAFIVLEGGTGTLLELAAVWELLNKGLIPNKPFACYGDMWKDIIESMEKRIAAEERRTNLIKHFTDIKECADFIIKKLKS